MLDEQIERRAHDKAMALATYPARRQRKLLRARLCQISFLLHEYTGSASTTGPRRKHLTVGNIVSSDGYHVTLVYLTLGNTWLKTRCRWSSLDGVNFCTRTQYAGIFLGLAPYYNVKNTPMFAIQ